MGTKFEEIVRDEHGIAGSGEDCGDNDSHHDRINVFTSRPWAARTCPARCSSTSSPGVISCNPKSPLGKLFSPEILVRQKLGQRPLQKG
jgi:hypothetical protein